MPRPRACWFLAFGFDCWLLFLAAISPIEWKSDLAGSWMNDSTRLDSDEQSQSNRSPNAGEKRAAAAEWFGALAVIALRTCRCRCCSSLVALPSLLLGDSNTISYCSKSQEGRHRVGVTSTMHSRVWLWYSSATRCLPSELWAKDIVKEMPSTDDNDDDASKASYWNCNILCFSNHK